METTHIMLEGRAIALAIRRLQHARRITLRLSAARDGIILTLPKRTPVAQGMDFFHSKRAWILEHVASDSGVSIRDGAIIPILGTDCIIRHRQGRGVTCLESRPEGNLLYIYGEPAFTQRRVCDFLKKHMLAHCTRRAKALATMIGKTVSGVRLRDMRACWGTCSAKGVLSFNWRLVFAPADVLDYLIAHEVAHLAEMNHSARFWKTVAILCPHAQTSRRWLRKEGHLLHRYG
jgi:predicted metal-dependent hydrolase